MPTTWTEYGRIGLEAVERKGVKFLARLNWYTIEFGLIRLPEGAEIYWRRHLLLLREARYVVEDPSAHWLGFDLERVLRRGYYIDDLLASYS
jgi:phenylalanine-4-hydroxylase